MAGKIRPEPVTPEVGRPYLRAVSNLQVLALLEMETASGEAGSRFEFFAMVDTFAKNSNRQAPAIGRGTGPRGEMSRDRN